MASVKSIYKNQKQTVTGWVGKSLACFCDRYMKDIPFTFHVYKSIQTQQSNKSDYLLGTMDSRPPNDNNDPFNNNRGNGKEDPLGRGNGNGRRGRGTGGSGAGPQLNENGQMDVFGDLRDNDIVVVLFMMGLASFLLREVCTC